MAKERVGVGVVVRRSEEDGSNDDSDVSKCGRLTMARWLVRRMRDIVNVIVNVIVMVGYCVGC